MLCSGWQSELRVPKSGHIICYAYSGTKITNLSDNFYYFCKLDLLTPKVIKKVLKISWLVLIAVAVFIFAGALILQLPQVQTFATKKVVEKLSEKLDGDIQFEKIHFKPFTTLVLKNVAIIDRNPVQDPTDSLKAPVDTFFRAEYIIARFTFNGLLRSGYIGISRAFISNAQMNLVLEDIIEFSELRDFMDVPMKNYSSGMLSRLAFAIATSGKADILIVDEVLAVGDFRFQQKCIDRIQGMMNEGTTVLFVSHSIEQVEAICNKVAWIKSGELHMFGDAKEICEIYKQS